MTKATVKWRGGGYNPHTFALILERTIKETLRNAGQKISVNSDFENAIELVENKAPYIQELIDNPQWIENEDLLDWLKGFAK